MLTKKIAYTINGMTYEGLFVSPLSAHKPLPTVLIVHDWSGRNAFAENKAHQLAELGYAAFAVDLYGQGKIGKNKEEKISLMTPLMQDRSLIKKRLDVALKTIKQEENVDTSHVAAIGFCFGGLCVLDFARSGADLNGVVSFHGLLHPPENFSAQPIKAKILALHGFDDPMVTKDQLFAFGEEMTAAHADWQLHIYGQAMHAFTNPEANDPSFGTVYNKPADHRSWRAMKDFFVELGF